MLWFFKSTHANFWFVLILSLVSAAFVFTSYSMVIHNISTRPLSVAREHASNGNKVNVHQQGDRSVHRHGEVRSLPMRRVEFRDSHIHHDDDTVAKAMAEKVRVLCWVMTAPKNLKNRATAVKETWSKRCNVLLFFSSVSNSSFPTIGLNVSEGRQHLTAKTMLAFRYIYQHHLNDADWFMKADDDTFVILENLRYFLSSQNTSHPVFFGHHFKRHVKQGYNSGGAGYVLSKEALIRFGKHGHKSTLCFQDGRQEDLKFGRCMENLGIKTVNSTDILGRTRFHCFYPEMHLFGDFPAWYYLYSANGVKKGIESISDYAISFHYIPPKKMYELEFFIYHLRPHGIISGNQHLNKDIPPSNN